MVLLRLGVALVTATAAASAHDPPASSAEVKITVEGDFRVIESNGRPNHTTGEFPNVGNPNRIQDQRYRFRVPLHPTQASHPVPARGITFGVALNGVVFDPGTAERWGSLHYEAQGGIDLGLDANHAHVQPTGAYHYHGEPRGLVAALGGNASHMLLLGYAADGFPIYASRCPRDPADLHSPLIGMRSSYRLKQGERTYGPSGRHDGTFVEDYEFVAGHGDLDACNGRTGPTPEFPQGTYYYALTPSYPFVPRLFRGVPDLSFSKFQIGAPEPNERLARRGQRGPPRGQGPGAPPQPEDGEGFPPPPPGGRGQGQGQGFPPPPPGGQGQGQGQGFPPPPGGQGQGRGFPPPPPRRGQGQGFPPPPPGGQDQGQGRDVPPPPPGGQGPGRGQGFPPPGHGRGFPPPLGPEGGPPPETPPEDATPPTPPTARSRWF